MRLKALEKIAYVTAESLELRFFPKDVFNY